MKWCVNIAIAAISLLLLPEASPAFTQAEIDNAKAAGTGAADLATGQLGSAAQLNTRAAAPLTSSNTPLTTLDGTVSGSGQISGQSSRVFLNLRIAPGGTGDLQSMIAAQDLDMDGTAETNYVAPFPVSGVCADGWISCDPGGWTNCSHWKWVTDVDGKLNVSPVSTGELGGCYCINNFCGSGLAFANISQVLGNLGGGAAAAVVQGNPTLQITRSEINGSDLSINFYGQDMTAVKLADGSINTTTANQTKYYAPPGQMPALDMSAEGTNLAIAQSSDPTSHYAMMTNATAATGSTFSQASCTVTRNIAVTTGISLCHQADPPGTLVGRKDTFTYYRVPVGSITLGDDCQVGKTCGGPIECYIPAPGSYWNYHYLPQDGMTFDVASRPPNTTTDMGGQWWVYTNCKAKTGTDDGSYIVKSYFKLCQKEVNVITESISNGCSGFEADATCSVLDEIDDGVHIIANGGATGLTLQPSRRDFTGTLAIYPVTRDWWVKQKTYRCETGTPGFDLSKAYERTKTAKHSTDNVAPGTLNYTYQDKTYDPATGTWTAITGTVELPPTDQGAPCQKVCKIKAIVNNTDETLASTADQQRSSAASLASNEQFEYRYKNCDSSATCPPLEPGEQLVKDCACTNDFAEATALMEALNRAGKDMICSDGTPK